MYINREDVFYYITVMNEPYVQPKMPKNVESGIIKGMYKYTKSKLKKPVAHTNLFGSGSIMNEVIKAGEILEKDYKIATDIWSITSYKELYTDAQNAERWNIVNPEKKPKASYIEQQLKNSKGVYIAASDYLKTLPNIISKWFPKELISLGTDGFGRSDGREALRNFFEVDYRYIVLAALGALYKENEIEKELVNDAINMFDIDPKKIDPMYQ